MILKKLPYVLIAMTFSLILVGSTFGAPLKTLPHRYTYDADMINSDAAGYTGAGVYVAVLDTGLVPNWRDYFPTDRIATDLGKGFWEPVHVDPKTGEYIYAGYVEETTWVGSVGSTHGTHVVSTIIGYNYYSPNDAAAGLLLQPVFVEGIAPDVTIIPVKVLTTYHLPPDTGPAGVVFGTDRAVAAGIYYATDLKLQGYSPMVISMSLGGSEPSAEIENAINYATTNGVIVVAAAGNDGNAGMDWPGAYPQVISVGANGWKYEWYWPAAEPPPRYRLWWLQDNTYGYRDIAEPTPAEDVYIADFSSRENDSRVPGYDQQLDVVAPGSWVRGPFPGTPGYAHLPWWSEGMAWAVSPNPGNFYYVGGTSMATPHVSAVAALMLEKNPSLTQAQVESIMKGTALPIPDSATGMFIFDALPDGTWGWTWTQPWFANATGSGLVQADAAVSAVP